MSASLLTEGASSGGGQGKALREARARDGAEPVRVVYCGRVWTGLTRDQMRRVPGSLPARVFARGSQLLGGSTVPRVGGAWEWRVAESAAPPEAVHAVVRFLASGTPLAAEWRERPGVRDLAVRWGLSERMLAT